MKKASTDLVAAFPMGREARRRDGDLQTWARVARDAYATYCQALERNPEATVTLTVSVERA